MGKLNEAFTHGDEEEETDDDDTASGAGARCEEFPR